MNKVIINVAQSDHEFVGINCKNETMTITFPIGYNIKEQTISATDQKKIQTIKPDTLKLLELLDNLQNNTYDQGQYKFNYSAANYLINDYFTNHLYQEPVATTSPLNNGAINWHQTIKSTLPIYTTGNFIYTNPISKNIKLQPNDITSIQIYCLNQAFSILGIFYNNLQISPITPLNESTYLYTLHKALTTTNNDHTKKLISTMIQFITGTSLTNSNNKELKVGTYKFHIIWEKYLKKYLIKQYPEKIFLPKAYYIINNNKIPTSSQKPDIIIESTNYLYIIDAKYYKINTLPQSSDIHKQLCYATYINNHTSKKIINIFLLPNLITTHPNYLYHGYATASNFSSQNGGQIKTYYLDTKTLLTNPNYLLNLLLKDTQITKGDSNDN